MAAQLPPAMLLLTSELIAAEVEELYTLSGSLVYPSGNEHVPGAVACGLQLCATAASPAADFAGSEHVLVPSSLATCEAPPCSHAGARVMGMPMQQPPLLPDVAVEALSDALEAVRRRGGGGGAPPPAQPPEAGDTIRHRVREVLRRAVAEE